MRKQCFGEESLTLISSRENSLVKEYTGLRDQKSRRCESGRFVIEGARLANDAILSRAMIVNAFVTEQARIKYGDCCFALEQRKMPVYDVTPAVSACLSDTRGSQGIFCTVEMPQNSLRLDNFDPNGVYLALENIQDPGNLGTILRTAEAMGIDGVILSEGCTDIFSPKVVRASMGAVFRLPFAAGADIPEAARIFKEKGIKVLAAVAGGGEDILSADLGGGVVAVIGNEGNGLTPECIKACSGSVTVKMRGRAESLNAAAAATIIIWEMTRHRV